MLTKEDIELEIESYDSMGDPKLIDFKDSVSFKLTSTYYVLKCRINNILATDGKRILGAVAFS